MAEQAKVLIVEDEKEMATTPIIMLTALGSRDDRLKGMELGADAYIPKPYSMKEVLISARRLIEKRWRQSVMAGEIAVLKHRAALQADLQNMLFHELRNQMVVIRGFSTLLGKNLRDTALEKPAGYADAIFRSSEYLGNLAEEFLLAGKFESGTLELSVEVIDLDGVLKETGELYRPVADEKGISVRIESEVPAAQARLNHAAVRLVISNLLDNAIKYSPRESFVKVGLQWEADDYIAVRVEDRGPGIRTGEAERIFDKFFRGGEAGEKTRGSGLGLYLARTLAEAMGGSIEVKSLPGEGSCFTARFPAWMAGEEAEGGQEQDRPLSCFEM
jgi:signal transduction histidine kinase